MNNADSNIAIFTFPNGSTVELEGPNAHPFACVVCESCYREHRHAARCCKVASLDLRNQTRRDWNEAYEAMRTHEDEARWNASMQEYHFECSCGESFKTVDDAILCRKCRTYAEFGCCTQVIDRNTNGVVWQSVNHDLWVARKAEEEAEVAEALACKPLTHNPFTALLS